MTDPDHTPFTDEPEPPRSGTFWLVGLLALGLLGWGAMGHLERDAIAAQTRDDTIARLPKVRAVPAERVTQPIELTLPGQTEAFSNARIFARATGYIAERKVDIGARVKAGTTLLRIAAPDLDQQLAQAQAQLGQLEAQLLRAKAMVDQAKANVNLAEVTNKRTSTLAGQGWASRQNADNSQASVLSQTANLASAEADVKVAEANIKAQQATVDRLKALTSFEIVAAPFDGIVTVRNVDIGDLVTADAGSGTPLLSMARDDLLRISVNVPQNVALGVKTGIEAEIKVPQMPGRSFSGTVKRSSGALLSASRTLTTQVDVPNPDFVLHAGLYVYVTLKIPRSEPAVRIPAEAMVFNQRGTQVAVVRDDGTAAWTNVHIKRDLGTSVELDQGLTGTERVVLSPPPDMRDGQKIELQPEQGEGKPTHSASR